MTPITHPAQPAAPTIQNRHQLDAVVENIVQLQLDHDELRRTQDQEITEIRRKYRTSLAEVERYLVIETSWVETWARNNPDAFGENQSLDCTHAAIGFRVTPCRVERASRRWTWSAISSKLADVAWGRRYLRVPPPEVNKEALLADRAELSATELRQVGIKIIQDERFFITPHRSPESAAASESDWQEAA